MTRFLQCLLMAAAWAGYVACGVAVVLYALRGEFATAIYGAVMTLIARAIFHEAFGRWWVGRYE